jgi:hypothetical protein
VLFCTILLSWFGVLLYILIYIWKSLYNPHVVLLLQIFVITSNVSGMRGTQIQPKTNTIVFAECGAVQAAAMVFCGYTLRILFQLVIHFFVYPNVPMFTL